jgi:WD40 repeat protein/Tfp pilus assembly protein PilF
VAAPDRPAPAPATAAAEDGPASGSFAGQPEALYFREIARLGAQVADALDYAHRQNVVHRDIKPSNLLLDAQGNAWVTDFGLAKLIEGEDLSHSRDLVGTLRFMAPERFRGVTDRRGDIYALGATLYELLTLRPAFSEPDHARLIDQITHQPPVPPRQHDRRIPRDLETLVLKALAKDPDDRFATAGELREELRRYLEGRPIRSRPIGAAERLWRWCKRNPALSAVTALAATLLVIGAIGASVLAYRNGRLADRNGRLADRNGRLAEQLKAQRDEADQNLVQARKNLIRSYTFEAGVHRQSRRVGQRFETLDAIEQAMQLAETVGITEAERLRLRNEAIAALALPDLRVAREIDWSLNDRIRFVVDPAFERYARRLDDGTVIVRRLADDAELIRLAGPPLTDASAAFDGFSPDGRHLAMISGGRDNIFQVWDLPERRLVLTDRALSANPWNWSFRPDGRELALGRPDGSIVFYELPGGRLLRRWTDHPISFDAGANLVHSPDSSRLAIRAKDRRTVQVLSGETGRLLAALSHRAPVWSFVWNPRRPNVLAVACQDRRIYLWDVDTRKQIRIIPCDSLGCYLAYHPNGELLASLGWEEVLRLWDTGTGRQVLNRRSSWSATTQFDRTGRWLSVEGTPKARILEVADAAEYRTLVAEPFREDNHHEGLAIDPTGRRAATTGSAVTVLDLSTGVTLATLPVTGDGYRILFDSSGAVLTELPALLRWPVTESADGSATIGPPQMLYPQGTREGFAITPDDRTIAAAMYDDGGLVFDTRNPRHARWLRSQRDVRSIAVSPDGRWVVTGSWGAHDMKLWDAQTGRLIHDFPGVTSSQSTVWSFSPDGRWLAVGLREGLILLETRTWTPRVRLSRGVCRTMAFAPDSRTVIYDDHAGILILAEVETGRELARFEDPEQAQTSGVAIARDGSYLVVTLENRPYLRIWDLRAIRRWLRARGLDWDPPASSETAGVPASFPPIPKPFRVDRGQLDSMPRQAAEQIVEHMTRAIESNPDDAQAHHQRGHALARLNRFGEAIADFTAALKASPNDFHLLVSRGHAEASLDRLDAALADGEAVLRQEPDQADRERVAHLFNDLARRLAAGPVPIRNAARAVDLARRAVDLAPDRATCLNTLGVAFHRAGRHAEAVPVLERSLAAGKGQSDAFDLFFLAMARHKLGQTARARADFDRALQWVREHPQQHPQSAKELGAFQAEAEAVLAGPPGEPPDDLFAPADRP